MEEEPEKRGPGQPSKYTKKLCKQAFRLCLLGSTNQQLADFFEVDISTIKKWMHDHEEFSASIKEGREDADAKVAQAMFKRAVGYKHKDVVITNYKGEIRETAVVKHYPPDTAAAQFWLTNRKQKNWKRRKEEGADEDGEGPGKEDNEFILNINKPKED